MNPAETGEAPVRADAEPETTANGAFDAAEDAQEALSPLPAPSPIIERLRAAYADANAERRKTFLIVPARYGGALGFRAHPIEYEEMKKEAERAQRRGMASAEAEVSFAAKIIAAACETILVADENGELQPAEQVVDEFRGTGPVRFDSRLCQMLGIDPAPESEWAVARLVYRNKQAMLIAMQELIAFFTEQVAGDEDEDDEERPT